MTEATPTYITSLVSGSSLSVGEKRRAVTGFSELGTIAALSDRDFDARIKNYSPSDQRVIQALRTGMARTGDTAAASGAKKKNAGVAKDGPLGQITLYSDGSMQLPKKSKAGEEFTVKGEDGSVLGLAKFAGNGKGDFGGPFQWTAKAADPQGKVLVRGGWGKQDPNDPTKGIPDASGKIEDHQWMPANATELAKVQPAPDAVANTPPGGIAVGALPHTAGGQIAVLGEHTVVNAPSAGAPSSLGNSPILNGYAQKAQVQGQGASTATTDTPAYNSNYMGGLRGDEAILASQQFTPPPRTVDPAAIGAGLGGIDQLGPLGAQVATRSGQGDVQGGFIPSKWVQGPDGSYHLETQQTSTVDDQMRRLYGMNPQELAMTQGALFQAGFYSKSTKSKDIQWGAADNETAAAWQQLLMDTQRLNAAGQLVSVDQVLASRSSAGATGANSLSGKGTAAHTPPTISPQEIAATTDAVATQILGRRATPEEERLVMAAVNKQMATQFTAQDTAGYQTGQQAASPSQIAQDVLQAHAPQEAVGNNFLGVFGAFQQMLGGLSGSSI